MFCFSYNYGPSQGNGFTCELNDADSSTHPDDLDPREGYTYQRAEVIKISQTFNQLFIIVKTDNETQNCGGYGPEGEVFWF